MEILIDTPPSKKYLNGYHNDWTKTECLTHIFAKKILKQSKKVVVRTFVSG